MEQCPAAFYKESDTCQSEFLLSVTSNRCCQQPPPRLPPRLAFRRRVLASRLSLPSGHRAVLLVGCPRAAREAVERGVELNSVHLTSRVRSRLPAVSAGRGVQPLRAPVLPRGRSLRSRVRGALLRRPRSAEVLG